MRTGMRRCGTDVRTIPMHTIGTAARTPKDGCRELRNAPYNSTDLRRRALPMTDTELSDMASAATTGLSRIPNAG